MDKIWELLSDNKIKGLLANCETAFDNDLIRLLFIELFSRIRELEKQNFTLRAILIEEQLIEEIYLNKRLKEAKVYLQQKDDEKEKTVNFLAASGVPFEEWVNFTLGGKFE